MDSTILNCTNCKKKKRSYNLHFCSSVEILCDSCYNAKYETKEAKIQSTKGIISQLEDELQMFKATLKKLESDNTVENTS